MNALPAAFEKLFLGEGLSVPAAPAQWHAALELAGPRLSRSADAPLLPVPASPEALDAALAQPAFVCGFEGEGLASTWFRFQVVTDRLGIFVRRAYGALSAEHDQRRVEGAIRHVNRLIRASEGPHWAGGGHLVILDDDSLLNRWGWSVGRFPAYAELEATSAPLVTAVCSLKEA